MSRRGAMAAGRFPTTARCSAATATVAKGRSGRLPPPPQVPSVSSSMTNCTWADAVGDFLLVLGR